MGPWAGPGILKDSKKTGSIAREVHLILRQIRGQAAMAKSKTRDLFLWTVYRLLREEELLLHLTQGHKAAMAMAVENIKAMAMGKDFPQKKDEISKVHRPNYNLSS